MDFSWCFVHGHQVYLKVLHQVYLKVLHQVHLQLVKGRHGQW